LVGRERAELATFPSKPGQNDLGVLDAVLGHQRIKGSGIFGRDAHAAMRYGLAEFLPDFNPTFAKIRIA